MSFTKDDIENLDFQKGDGLIPAVVQDSKSGRVLMLGYMNIEALEKTLDSGKVTFFSRSRQTLWTKGETSDNFLMFVDMKTDCDRDTLLVFAKPIGPTCHMGTDTCFGNDYPALSFLSQLESVIEDRKLNPSDQSYTTSLFKRGIDKIAQKVGEEAVEVVIEAKNNDEGKFLGEAADLVYHLMVLLAEKEVALEKVLKVLKDRHQ